MNNLPKFEKHGFSELLNLPFDIQVSTIGSALGYGAISAVVPIVLLSSIFSSTPFPELALSSNYLVQGFYILIPALLFLLTASITGAFLTAFSDHFLNRKHILFCYLASLLLAVFTLFSISKYLVLLSLGISYALSRFLWKIHILNKDMNAYAIAFASVFTGLFVLSSIFLVTSALTILPTLLIILSNGFFALAIVNTCTDWVVVPRAALLGRKKNIGRIMLPTAANVLTGIALGVIMLCTQEHVDFLLVGSIWILVGILSAILLFTNTHLRKQNLRGAFLLLVIGLFLAIIMGSQHKLLCVLSSCLILFATFFFIINNTLRHSFVQKDSDLCDVYLSAFRIFTNPLGMIFGLVASFSMLSNSPNLQLVGLCLMIIASLFSITAILFSLGIFEKDRSPKRCAENNDKNTNAKCDSAPEQSISPDQLDSPSEANESIKNGAADSTDTDHSSPQKDELLSAEGPERKPHKMLFFDEESPKETADEWQEKAHLTAKINGLTSRQVEIFEALSRGRNARYIAQRLYLSEGAVKKQMFTIYKKLDIHKQQDLITMVMDGNLEELRRKAAKIDLANNHK